MKQQFLNERRVVQSCDYEDIDHGSAHGDSGLFLGLLLWILVGQPQDGESPIVEALVCNAIPLASIFSGLFFGWVTGSEYAE